MPMSSSITDQMVEKHIKPLPLLTTLDISYCYNITGKGIEAFGNNCKSLVKLRRNMLPFPHLQEPIDDSEAKAIAETMPKLEHIDLSFGQFGDMGLVEILNKCKSLNHLDIHGSWNVELNGDTKERCEKLNHFQNPHFNYENDLSDSNDDESEEESESDCDEHISTTMTSITAEQINDPNKLRHCPACKNGRGAYRKFAGLKSLVDHANSVCKRRPRTHRRFAKLLEQALSNYS